MTLITIIQYDTNYELLNSYQTVIDDKIELPGNFKLSGITINNDTPELNKILMKTNNIMLNKFHNIPSFFTLAINDYIFFTHLKTGDGNHIILKSFYPNDIKKHLNKCKNLFNEYYGDGFTYFINLPFTSNWDKNLLEYNIETISYKIINLFDKIEKENLKKNLKNNSFDNKFEILKNIIGGNSIDVYLLSINYYFDEIIQNIKKTNKKNKLESLLFIKNKLIMYLELHLIDLNKKIENNLFDVNFKDIFFQLQKEKNDYIYFIFEELKDTI